MKIVFLTPGTGSYYCGACMRDNALARELLRAGHDVTIAPMYLPLMIDEDSLPGLQQVPIFFGGINVYLQQKLAFFRKTPAAIDRLLNSTGLLRWAARHTHMTTARDHGEMTLEMLNVESSRFHKEWEKLLTWLQEVRPDIVCLSNALLAGLAAELYIRLGTPVVTFFQGEDSFLDGLPEPYRAQCWAALSRRLAESDLLLAPSEYYAQFMRERLGADTGPIEVLHNGISLERFALATAPPDVPAIGYLARMIREKGLELLVAAFFVLVRDLGDTRTRLRIGGAATAADEPLIADLKKRIGDAGLTERVDWAPNLSHDAKVAFLRSLTLFSVPAVYREAFGLYVIEAMACGIPVVQPASSAFPEIIAAGGGGVCVPPEDPKALALAWRDLLADAPRRAALGAAARASVEQHFSSRSMGEHFLQATARLTRVPA